MRNMTRAYRAGPLPPYTVRREVSLATCEKTHIDEYEKAHGKKCPGPKAQGSSCCKEDLSCRDIHHRPVTLFQLGLFQALLP